MKSKRFFSPAMRTALTDMAVLLLCALFFGLILLAPLASAEEALTAEERALEAAQESGELIRLHIVAASDRPEDQQRKLRVRDAVLAAFGEALEQAGAESAEAAWRLLQASAASMEAVARLRAQREGFTGPVNAEVGLLELPEKRYGRVMLPRGTYRGLRIVLGAGEGQNWWCVLFPQLCLALADDEPWTAAPRRESETISGTEPQAPEIVWDSEAILSRWLLHPGASTPPKVAAEVVHPEQNQGRQHAADQ